MAVSESGQIECDLFAKEEGSSNPSRAASPADSASWPDIPRDGYSFTADCRMGGQPQLE
jgi:hypothetical protein